MNRPIIYLGAQALDTDILRGYKEAMIGIGGVLRAIADKRQIAVGFDCTPTTPASLSVTLDSGGLTTFAEIDDTDYGRLVADPDLIQKLGYVKSPQTFTVTPPTTAGQTRRYILQATTESVDTDALTLPYYNDSNPNQPLYGPNNDGSAQFTTRAVKTAVQLKAGTAANTGTETTPPTSVGYVGLWIISVSYGQTTVTATHITKHPEFPSAASAGFTGVQNQPIFTTSTTYTFGGSAPAWAKVTVIGGGGGGGGAQSNGGSGGGGGGGTASAYLQLIPGQQYAITVGVGGAAGTNSASGNGGSYPNPDSGSVANWGGNGGSSSFAGLVNATGGAGGGGVGGYGIGHGGLAGIGSFAAPASGLAMRGGDGDCGYIPGVTGATGARGSRGGSSALGGGGRSSSGASWGSAGVPTAGGFPGGGGGGGGSNNLGAAGAPGVVFLEF